MGRNHFEKTELECWVIEDGPRAVYPLSPSEGFGVAEVARTSLILPGHWKQATRHKY